MVKRCVICGAEFSAPPSSKKITCSKACSTKRKSETHSGNHYHKTDKSRREQSERMKAQGFTQNARHALSVAMSIPEGQRGEQHRDAKVWTLIDPSGNVHVIINLLHWARQHAELFQPIASASERERAARNIASGIRNIALSARGLRKPVSTYKGWRLAEHPKDKPTA